METEDDLELLIEAMILGIAVGKPNNQPEWARLESDRLTCRVACAEVAVATPSAAVSVAMPPSRQNLYGPKMI